MPVGASMQDKMQYFPTAVSFPGTACRFQDLFPSDIIIMPSVGNQGRDDGDSLRRYEAQQQRGRPSAGQTGAIETRAVEMSAGEIKDVSSRTGRLLSPPFGVFLRAALLAHLERTFR